MHPYYLSWKSSSHNKIACVDCHIPPGIESELRKKYEALSMVARYFTGTYGTHPWAEVEDASCLRCHERRLVAGKETFKGVVFNHTPHLTEMRKGKQLRCTSCHSQIVQGRHIAVTTSTCFLCHFKNQQPGKGTARCLLCHDVPEKTIRRAGLTFNHGDVKRFDMKCDSCHANVVTGEGDVPENRCLTCHNEMNRLAKYGQTEELHRIHVTQHKVECLHCHNEIQHGRTTMTAQAAMPKNSCESCHGTGHSPQQNLYAGTGGIGVSATPSPMYLAGIRCEGCHFLESTGNTGHIKVASDISCMACHGAHFAMIFARWQTVGRDRLQQARLVLETAKSRLNTPYPQPLLDATHNIDLVEKAHPVHNVTFSLALLDKSADLINVALKERGKAEVSVPWQKIPFTSSCLSCHQGIESQSARYGSKPFAHFPHVVKNELDCEICHEPHQIPLKGKRPIIAEVDCADCHHEAAFADRCVKCHEQQISQPVKVQGAVLDRKGLLFEHAMHIEATNLKCVQCHLPDGNFSRTPDAKICKDCH